jgi:mRNA-degrading endonuclease RelE of RelBE toxin-antitoxin system
MKNADINYLYRGSAFHICELVVDGKNLVKDFIKSELTKEEQKKIFALLQRTADNGVHPSDQKFKLERDGIYVFKSFQTRIFCAFHARRIILLTHGVKKKKDKADKADIERAIRLLEETGYKKG